MPSAAQPSHDSRAPATMKPTVNTACHTRWWMASSFVSQEPKKLGTRANRNRLGRRALIVNAAPTRLTARNREDTERRFPRRRPPRQTEGIHMERLSGLDASFLYLETPT